MKWDNLITTFLETNSHLNLSAIRDSEGVRVKHIMDSIELDRIFSFAPGTRIADLGTGGGFPLLPLALLHPECQFTGIDSIKKKTVAVQAMADGLGLKNVRCLWSRAEDVHETFDVVTSRAVGYVDKLLERSKPLLHSGSFLILYKQAQAEELADLKRLAPKYHLKHVQTHRYTLFEGDIERVIYILERK